MARNPPVSIEDIAGAPPSAANPLPVRLSDGAAFYNASGGAGGGAISTAAKGTTPTGSPTSTDVDANRQALDVYVRGGGAGGGAVTVADGADIAQGAVGDAVWVSGGNGSLIAISKYEAQKLEAIRALLAGSIAVTGTFWQATQPVSGPLTDAQLRATAVPVIAAGDVAAGAADSGNPVKVGGKYNLTIPTLSDGQRSDLQVDPRGSLRVELRSSGSAVAVGTPADTLSNAQAALVTQGLGYVFNGVTWDRLRGDATNGAKVQSGQLPAALAAGGGLKIEGVAGGVVVPVSDGAGSLTVDAPVGTPVFVRLSDGAAAISALPVTDNGGLISVDDGAGSLTVDGTVTSNAAAATSGGATPAKWISTATTNATSVKGSAGQVYGWYLYNANAAVRYLKLYNKASAPTVGTDVPVLVIPIPPGSAANMIGDPGLAFGTGIAFAITTGVADADTGAVAANEIVVNLFTK